VGIGGRKTPKLTFRVNQSRADLFSTRVFWSLNPMKLFRRQLLQTLDLKFATDLPWGEDMPFVAESFLNASVITIVADYDCVYLTYRDDGNNFTKRVSSAQSRLGCPTRLLEMIERYVLPGRRRDYLMSRVFGLEVINILPRLAQEPNETARLAGFETIKGWVDRWYTRPIAWRLSPLHRIALNLVRRGNYAEVAALFPEWPATKNWNVVVEGDRVFADYPYFRDPALAVPDDCYEITRRLKAHCHIDRVTRRERTVAIEGYAYVDLLETDGMQASVLLRRRGGGAEYRVPTDVVAHDGLAAEEWNRVITRETSGFVATLDPATVANGAFLPAGWWEAWIRIASEGVTRDAWIGSVSCKVTAGVAEATSVSLRQLDAELVAIGDESPTVPGPATWVPGTPRTLEVAGRCDPSPSGVPTLTLVLLRRQGGEHRLKVEVEGDRFSARLPLRSIDGGRPLERGTWDVVLERCESGSCTIVPVPVSARLAPAWGRSGLWPSRTTVVGPSAVLVITSERIDPRWLLSRLSKRFRFVARVFRQRT
jgi:hypothetical protein